MAEHEPGEGVPAGRIAQVLLPLPLPEAFDYAEPEGLGLAVGDHVAVPLGPRLVRGVVVAIKGAAGANRPLKAVESRLADPPMPLRAVEFVEWAARYGVDFPGRPLAMAIRGLGARRPAPQRHLAASGLAPGRPTPARARVLAAATSPMTPGELARAAGVSVGVLAPLLREGVLTETWVTAEDRFEPPDPSRPGASLNPGQEAAAASLTDMIEAGGFAAALLDGVTGSGKTEVYLEAVAAALAGSTDGQVLVLLPEIALTAAVIDRFERRFGAAPAQWHSGMAPGRRRAVWEGVARGEARIVVGARSALFLPFVRLALIVVDEEHDGAYKQEDGFIYQARDLAVARAKIENCAAVLASATPSLETLWNARAGRYRWLKLSDRHGAAVLPEVTLIDLRAQSPEPGAWLSPPLVDAMEATLARDEQALLFLNRRGYAPLVLCRACGERLRAPDTDSWLVEHRYSGRLVCHLTGFSMPKPRRCPHCQAEDSLVSVGPGVERVEEEARRRFPKARLAVFSSDTVADAQAARDLVDQMAAGEIDILVATQAAAKGHDFPHLTLVGVVDADLGLRGGDLRAAERTFQLLTQVSGRAGRRERRGRALIQTWAPEHPVMAALASADRDAFIETEMAERQEAGLPPFARLAAVIVSAPDPATLDAFARAMAAEAPNADGVEVYGPADAPLGLVRGRRRKRFLVRAERSVDLSAFMQTWRARVRPPGMIRLTIDIDPYNFL
ncbi:MAG TPA: primosomal protein N' [Caulobacteraceae bacterium]|jgi:primosomal protein N' (replication factor Y)